MKPETEFVYDWIKAYVKLLGPNSVKIQSFASTADPDGFSCWVDFLFDGGRMKRYHSERLNVPAWLGEHNLYRALLAVSEEYGINHNIKDDWIRTLVDQKTALQYLNQIA